MATRQKPPARKSPAPSSSQSATTQADESRPPRTTFAPNAFDATTPTASDNADVPKATFVGEQVVYKDRNASVAEAAYFRAQQRGFAPGYEIEDWLAAEREIDALLASARSSTRQ